MSVSCSVGRASAIPNNFHAFGEGPRRWPQSVQNTQAGGAMGSQVSPQIEICVLVSSVERSTALLTTFGLRLNIARSTWVCVVSFAGLFGRQATGGLTPAGSGGLMVRLLQLVVGIAPAAEADARISRIGRRTPEWHAVKVCDTAPVSTPNNICSTGTESIGTTGRLPLAGDTVRGPDATVMIASPRLASIGRSPPWPDAITGAIALQIQLLTSSGGGGRRNGVVADREIHASRDAEEEKRNAAADVHRQVKGSWGLQQEIAGDADADDDETQFAFEMDLSPR